MKFAAQLRGSGLPRSREKGYILLTMLLVIALMAIFALTVITEMKFTIKRDQEQEMIRRGVQYSRAVRGYYKKFGRYPTRLEDLDNTNNLRYLRKHYKDPITGQDFKLLHFGEQGVTLGSGGISFGGGTIPGATPVGAPGGLSSGPGNSAFGGSTFGNSGNGVNNSGVFAQSSSGFGGNSNSSFGASSNPSAGGSNTPGTNPANGTDPSSAQNSQDPSSTKISSVGASDQSSSQQPVGGGPIVGVASLSKKTTIREFNKKKKYNEWQFVYDPTTEPRNGLITTPNQPLLQGFGTQPLQNGMQPGSTNGSAFGTSSSFGNNSNSSGSAAPTPPPANPPQPQ